MNNGIKFDEASQIYGDIKYFELYPFNSNGEPFIVSFDNTIRSINKKLKGITHKMLMQYIDCNDDISYENANCIKTDILTKISLKDRWRLRKDIEWSHYFTSYRYCMIQLGKTVELIAINNIKALEVPDKYRSKIITTTGEVSLYNLCMELQLFYKTTKLYPYNISESNQLFKDIKVVLLDNALFFIKYANRSKDSTTNLLRCLNYSNVMSVLGTIREGKRH